MKVIIWDDERIVKVAVYVLANVLGVTRKNEC